MQALNTPEAKASPGLTTLRGCIVCGGDLVHCLRLGDHYLTDFLDHPDSNHPKAPLNLTLCTRCWLPQLEQVVQRDVLFRNYHYLSGINAGMRTHLSLLAGEMRKRIRARSGFYVVDIGANDGTLLDNFPDAECRVGFEPARNCNGNYEKVEEYFSKEDCWK